MAMPCDTEIGSKKNQYAFGQIQIEPRNGSSLMEIFTPVQANMHFCFWSPLTVRWQKWRCEHARFCVEVFLCAIYKFSFIHSFKMLTKCLKKLRTKTTDLLAQHQWNCTLREQAQYLNTLAMLTYRLTQQHSKCCFCIILGLNPGN